MPWAPTLAIRLLGTLDLRVDGRPVPSVGSARAESLLAYLLLHRDAPHPREQLAFLLWPDSTETQARTNLRHVLHDLRRGLTITDQLLDVRTRTVQWRPDIVLALDVAAFDAAIAGAERSIPQRDDQTAAERTIAFLREAVDLYRGDLLETCYDEWITSHRDRLRQQFIVALERLGTLLAEQHHHAEAIACAERLLRCEPLRENTYRLLMRLHDARGDRAMAIQTYRTCTATLRRELGAEPSAATRQAYEALSRPAERPGPASAASARPSVVSQPPLVGRANEWTALTALWRSVESGRRAFLLVTGEAGVGKTRLVEELQAWCEGRGAVVAEARSYAAEGELAYAPLAAWLKTPAIEQHAARLDPARASELVRLLPELWSRVPGATRPPTLPEDEQRHRLFDAAVTLLSSLGVPLLIIADDIQWCDHETLRFLHYLLRSRSRAPLLVAATARAEEMPRQPALAELLIGLRALGSLTELELQRLRREETTDLASRLVSGSLDAHDADALFQETEGNPLFVVEAIRAGWRRATSGRDAMTPRVQAVIRSRLDHLSVEARALVDTAATLGRDFTVELLGEASGATSIDTVTHDLDELWRTRIVREHAPGIYDFTHDKIREVAYSTLSPPQRRQSHLRAAQALKRLHASDPSPVSGSIAAHYERAGLIEEAITWYETAAAASQQLYASHEAARLLAHARDLLASLPSSPERQARELAILTAMLAPVASVDGFGSPWLEEVQTRTVALAAALAVDLPAQAMRSIAVSSLTRDDFETARRYGEMLRVRGESHGDDALAVESAYVSGIAAFWSGRFAVARDQFQTAAARYRPERRSGHLLRYGLDPQVICVSRLGNTYWFLGDPDAARAARDRALALGLEVGHSESYRTALVFAAFLALDMGDIPQLREYVRALEAGANERDARPTRFATASLRAFVRVVDGDVEAGLDGIRTDLANLGGRGFAPGQRACTVRLLLAAHDVCGDTHGRLAVADQMLAMGGAAGVWEAEVHRVRAECLEALHAAASDVVAALERAVAVARSQGAGLLERRANEILQRRGTETRR